MSEARNLFNQLSDEIIIEIIDWLKIENFFMFGPTALNPSIWNLSMCSRRLRRIGSELLYKTIRVTNSRRLDELLQTVIKVPTYGNLVKEMFLDWEDEDDGFIYDVKRILSQNFSSDETTAFMNVARDHGLPQGLIDELSSEVSWARALLLLHLLPNLEVLCINPGGGTEKSHVVLLFALIQNSQLSLKLRSFTRDWKIEDGQRNLSTLLPIFFHPPIREVRALEMITSSIPSNNYWLPKGTTLASFYGTSNVESLELYGSCTNSSEIEQLFQLPRALKRLIYVHDSDETFDIEPVGFLRKSLQHVAGTLEIFRIEWSVWFETHSIWSFSAFRQLRKLFINCDLLLGPNVATAPPISTLLPMHLEVLGMYFCGEYRTPWSTKGLIAQVTRLLLDKSPSCVPHLQVITHLDSPYLLSSLVDLGSERNVKIELEKINI
ncbi:hypothetical protein CPB86DRAFT_872117 [Serendipita vermifera]|nr:hypothetical protein CPB86DRAFT_872117 [Serendipita vermifera]